MKVLYGIEGKYLDVTECLDKRCIYGDYICIPKTDCERASLFSDPLVGILKHILIVDDKDNKIIFPSGEEIKFDKNQRIFTPEELNTAKVKNMLAGEKHSTITFQNAKDWYMREGKNITNPVTKLNQIQEHLHYVHGSPKDEYPEQLMTVMFLKSNAKVLEIGSNVGRNTMVISTILDNDTNFVTMESDKNVINKLTENKNANNLNFLIENSAISKRILIQKEWDTKPIDDSNNIPDNWKLVPTITYDDLVKKYNIMFDTLVADCEGALYYIIMDFPNILNNLHTIIMENDYTELDKKNYVDKILTEQKFKCVFSKSGGQGPCFNFFYEVWTKNNT